LYGGHEDSVQTRVGSSQGLLICTRPAVFSAAEWTFARHGWKLLSRLRGSESVRIRRYGYDMSSLDHSVCGSYVGPTDAIFMI